MISFLHSISVIINTKQALCPHGVKESVGDYLKLHFFSYERLEVKRLFSMKLTDSLLSLFMTKNLSSLFYITRRNSKVFYKKKTNRFYAKIVYEEYGRSNFKVMWILWPIKAPKETFIKIIDSI